MYTALKRITYYIHLFVELIDNYSKHQSERLPLAITACVMLIEEISHFIFTDFPYIVFSV